ncbi:TlpA disulfide reductase family protein, partial [Calditrichota bacterium]
KDGKYFSKAAEKFGDAEDLIQVVFNYFMYAQDYKNAQKLLENAKKSNSKWADERSWAILNVGLGNKDQVKKYIQMTSMEKQKDAGEIPPEKITKKIEYDIYRSAFAYEPLMEYYLEKTKDDPGEYLATYQYNVACFAALSGKTKMALKYLAKSAENGFYDAPLALEDSDIFALHKEAGWDGIIKKFETNWDSGEEMRMKKALASKFEKAAPDWTLEDASGEMVQLASLKGNVVVLDFWSSWCKPCQEIMPELDKFTREYAVRGVKVYSVNVMEKNPALGRDFMKKHDYAMTYLQGTEEMQKNYKVESVPTIYMIDQNGNIRYVHHGSAKDLKTKLSWWANDLLKTEAAMQSMAD